MYFWLNVTVLLLLDKDLGVSHMVLPLFILMQPDMGFYCTKAVFERACLDLIVVFF